MTLAWPRLEIDPGELGPREFKSLGLEVLCNRLQDDRKYHILDLGAAHGANVQFFSALSCRIYVEDIFGCLSRLPPRTEEDAPFSKTDLDRLLVHDRGVRFDIILGWDLFDYLDADVISQLMGHLREFCRRGTNLFIMTSTRGQIPAEPGRFTIGEDYQLLYEPRSIDTINNPNHTPLAFEKMMKGFHLLHSFMLKNGMQEYVFSAD